jgi:damage-control phosphatase, subfamily I
MCRKKGKELFAMKVTEHCLDCLKGLAWKTIQLSGGKGDLLSHCHDMIEESHDKGHTPPGISNKLLKHIKHTTGAYDPYALAKAKEFEEAGKAFAELIAVFPETMEGLLKMSALGNSMDFFTEYSYDTKTEALNFYGDIDKIEKEIYIKNKDVLLLGDNVGDFIFDMPLVKFLQDRGKTVYYAVKEHPVQNDLSIADVERFKLKTLYPNIISTGTDEVGLRREEMKGKVKELWEADATVIAKGMGNYETLSEYSGERTVIHIMKVKCPAVSRSAQHEIGTYVAILH